MAPALPSPGSVAPHQDHQDQWISGPSPGSVDPRRHSAYLRPMDDALAVREEDERQLLSQLQQSSPDYSQHSLPRQYLSKTATSAASAHHHLHGIISSSAGGSSQQARTSSSPLGFSSTLQPRHFGGQGNSGGQRVTKPSSQTTKCSSDHESSV